MTNVPKRFLIVDDDPLNNYLSIMVLKKSLGNVNVTEFVIPELALDYIKTRIEYQPFEEKTTLLLDINMPSLTGWDFLDIFKTYRESIQEQFNVYILSSSVDPMDIQRAKRHPIVIDYIEKPLSKAILTKLFN